MNAIPLVFNAPKANINVNSVSPINANSIRTNNKLINATQGMNIGGAAGMLGGGGFSNEAQLRQEVNTSIVALKREAFSLENLIAQAAQTLQDINKRLSELEGKQGDYVKKADATVAGVGGDGKYISAISETDGKINATATDLGNMVPVNSVTSGNMHSVTSGAVAQACTKFLDYANQITIANLSSWTATVDCYVLYFCVAGREIALNINNKRVSSVDNYNNVFVNAFSGYVRKNDVITCSAEILGSGRNIFRAFPFSN